VLSAARRCRSCPVDSDLVLKIGTWNVEYGRGADKNTRRLALLLAQEADVWVLTETHDDLDLSPEYTSAPAANRYPRDQRSRWTTIWTKWPIVERIETRDPARTLALSMDIAGWKVVVYGTVLPWQHDTGPSMQAPGWTEFARVTPLQGEEWARLREVHPEAVVIVAGDLNQNLGGMHYYGTKSGRKLLRNQLSAADLVCLSDADEMRSWTLANPPIDHVCVGVPAGSQLKSRLVTGWEGAQSGIRLSDHSAVVAEMRIRRVRADTAPSRT
jgi:endonuclease/exonuclease/phosphatase family metal-dependent hydrolase